MDEGAIEQQKVTTCRLPSFLLPCQIYICVTYDSALMSFVLVFLYVVFVVVMWYWVCGVVFVYVVNVFSLFGFLAGRW